MLPRIAMTSVLVRSDVRMIFSFVRNVVSAEASKCVD
jgi:hypothetical protein